MAIVIPAGCGGGSEDEPVKPQPYTPQPDYSQPDNPQPPVTYSAPTITVIQREANVFGGAKVEQADSMLLIGGDTIACWTTGNSKLKSVTLTFNGSAISLGTVLSEKGTLSLTVTNQADKYASSSIALTDEALS